LLQVSQAAADSGRRQLNARMGARCHRLTAEAFIDANPTLFADGRQYDAVCGGGSDGAATLVVGAWPLQL
jgi:hypothetical protein